MTEKPYAFTATILTEVLRDFAKLTSISPPDSCARDCFTVLQRFDAEGLEFVCVKLKEISDGVLHLLEYNCLPTSFGFRRRKGSQIPVFLGDYWAVVLKPDGTRSFDDVPTSLQIEAIKVLYQIGSSFAKLEVDYNENVVASFIKKFADTDASLGYEDTPFIRELISRATNVVYEITKDWDLSDVSPKHGPGAVAGGEKQERKWNFSTIFLNSFYEYDPMEYFFVGPRHLLTGGGLDELSGMEWKTHSTAKFHLVPKTYSTPRGICIEPKEIQYLQQGQLAYMVDKLESNHWTKGHINFRSQDINRNLALQNSFLRDFATIDLSDASDRVSSQLIADLFRNQPKLLSQLRATRSSHVTMPDGSVVKLRKFSPMGSAVCFPLESLAFFSVCVAAIAMEAKVAWQTAANWTYVYGDDIIIPTAYFDQVVNALQMIDMVVNIKKSYWKGHFRESCGMHALYGHDITPLRFKKILPSAKSDGNAIKSWISYAHSAERRGLTRVAEHIYTNLEALLGVKLPYNAEDSGWVCRLCDDPSLAYYLNVYTQGIKRKWNEHLQRMEFRVPYLSGRFRDTRFDDGWKHLLRNLLVWIPFEDPSRVVVINSTRIKFGYQPII